MAFVSFTLKKCWIPIFIYIYGDTYTGNNNYDPLLIYCLSIYQDNNSKSIADPPIWKLKAVTPHRLSNSKIF